MGNSNLNCFKSKPKPAHQPLPSSVSQPGPSFAAIRHWKQALGCDKTENDIVFEYDTSIVHPTFRQIEKDILRTYPQSPFFMDNETNQDIFRQVLRKLAVYFPRVGYTQGINFLAGYFLINGLSSQQTFTICVKLLTHQQLLLIGLYQDEFPLNRFYCCVFWAMLNKLQPQASQKLSGFGLPDEVWIFQWYMVFFVFSFPLEYVHQFLTYVFTKKKFAFIKLTLAIVMELWPYIKTNQNQA